MIAAAAPTRVAETRSAPSTESTLAKLDSQQLVDALVVPDKHRDAFELLCKRVDPETTAVLCSAVQRALPTSRQPLIADLSYALSAHLEKYTELGHGTSDDARTAARTLTTTLNTITPSSYDLTISGERYYWQNTLGRIAGALGKSEFSGEPEAIDALSRLARPEKRYREEGYTAYENERQGALYDYTRQHALEALGHCLDERAMLARRENLFTDETEMRSGAVKYAANNDPNLGADSLDKIKNRGHISDAAAALVRESGDLETIGFVKERILNHPDWYPWTGSSYGRYPETSDLEKQIGYRQMARYFQAAGAEISADELTKFLEITAKDPFSRDALLSGLMFSRDPKQVALAIADMPKDNPAPTLCHQSFTQEAFTQRFEYEPKGLSAHQAKFLEAEKALRQLEIERGAAMPMHGVAIFEKALTERCGEKGFECLAQRFEHFNSPMSFSRYGLERRTAIAHLFGQDLQQNDSLAREALLSGVISPEATIRLLETVGHNHSRHLKSYQSIANEFDILSAVAHGHSHDKDLMVSVVHRVDTLLCNTASHRDTAERLLKAVVDSNAHQDVKAEALKIFGQRLGTTDAQRSYLLELMVNEPNLRPAAITALQAQSLEAQKGESPQRYLSGLRESVSERVGRLVRFFERNPAHYPALQELGECLDLVTTRPDAPQEHHSRFWNAARRPTDADLCQTLSRCMPALLAAYKVAQTEKAAEPLRGMIRQSLEIFNEAGYADTQTSILARTANNFSKGPQWDTFLRRDAEEHLRLENQAGELGRWQRFLNRFNAWRNAL